MREKGGRGGVETCIERMSKAICLSITITEREKENKQEVKGETDRGANKQTNREREREIQIEKQTDRNIQKERYRLR